MNNNNKQNIFNKKNIIKVVITVALTLFIMIFLNVTRNIVEINTIKYNSNIDINIKDDIYNTAGIIPDKKLKDIDEDSNNNLNNNGNNSSNNGTLNGINNGENNNKNNNLDNNSNNKNTKEKTTNNGLFGGNLKGKFLVKPELSNTKLRSIQNKNKKSIWQYRKEYNNSAILGTIAYILRFFAGISIPIFIIFFIISYMYGNVFKTKNADESKGHNIRSAAFKFMIICQITPLIFALLAKGWRK